MNKAVPAPGVGPSATNPLGCQPGGVVIPNGPIDGGGAGGGGAGPVGSAKGRARWRREGRARGVRAAARRRRAGAGGKQDGGGVSGAEGGGGSGRPRVRPGRGRRWRRRRRRAAPRPPCMGWALAPPRLLHARGGRGGGRAARAPLASGTPGPGPVACAASAVQSAAGSPRPEGRSRRRSGRKASAGCRLGRGAPNGPARSLGHPRPVWGLLGDRLRRKLLPAAGGPRAASLPRDARPGPAAAD